MNPQRRVRFPYAHPGRVAFARLSTNDNPSEVAQGGAPIFRKIQIGEKQADGTFVVPPEGATAMILSLAAGEVNEEGFTRWIRDNWPPEPPK